MRRDVERYRIRCVRCGVKRPASLTRGWSFLIYIRYHPLCPDVWQEAAYWDFCGGCRPIYDANADVEAKKIRRGLGEKI
jgi:hypothetical protein